MLERDTKQKRVRQECARQMAEAPLSKTKKQHSFVRPLGRARGIERALAEERPHRLNSFAWQILRCCSLSVDPAIIVAILQILL
ncbi:unnamed protein product [Arctia plantaginis]|uniref:Uncharacterized protein n=1 Tax=Arctia plantaginis TaxID=874455 RepID=A0A8S0ZS69_ARCPL|nr:unnamed protein product [Arctia plantaginis]